VSLVPAQRSGTQNGEDEQSSGAIPAQLRAKHKKQPGASPRATAQAEITGCVYKWLCVV